MPPQSDKTYQFGPFCLELKDHLLSRNGKLIPLTPKAFEVLVCLIERQGHLVRKDELMQEVWGGSFVEEGNVSRTVWMLRNALSDDRNGHKYIQTVPKLGYRFVADVNEINIIGEPSVVAQAFNGKGESDSIKSNDDDKILNQADEVDTGERQSDIADNHVPVRTKLESRFWLWLIGSVSLFGLAIIVFQLGFGGFKPNSEFSFERMRQVRLTQDENVYDPVISPDGQYIAYISVGNGTRGLSLRQIATGTTLPIVAQRTGVNYWDLIFAPDNSNFYFVSSEESTGTSNLYRTSTLGGWPQKLCEHVNGGMTFSPDGKQIAFKRINDPVGQSIIVVNNDGTGEHMIASVDVNSDYQTIDWAPDNSTIAFSVREHSSEKAFSYIAEIPVAGGEERRIGEPRDGLVMQIRWRRDKSGFFMCAIDPATKLPQIYFVSYPFWVERRVTNDLNHYGSISLTADGNSLVAQLIDMKRTMWIAADGDATKARLLENSAGHAFDMVAWTADGNIVFDPKDGNNDANNNIWRIRSDGSELEKLTSGDGQNISPTVSPDGSSIAFISRRSGTAQVWRINSDGSQPTQLTDLPYFVLDPRFAPDGRAIYFTAGTRGQWHIWRVSINGGDAAEFSDAPVDRWAISPDGEHLAYSYFDAEAGKFRVRIRPLDEDRTEKLLDIVPDTWMQWAYDGQAIYYNDRNRDAACNLWRQPLDGSPPFATTDFKTEQLLRFAWSSDGKRLALVRYATTYDAVLIKFQ